MMNSRITNKYLYLSLAVVITVLIILQGLLPVVSNTVISNERVDGSDLIFDVTFTKNRACEFQALHWYDMDNQRIPILFNPEEIELSTNRPIGPQYARNWRSVGINSLKNTYAIAIHNCFGVQKQTIFYRGTST